MWSMVVPSQHWVMVEGWLGLGVNFQLLASSLPQAVVPFLLVENEENTTVAPGTDIRVLFPPAQFKGGNCTSQQVINCRAVVSPPLGRGCALLGVGKW